MNEDKISMDVAYLRGIIQQELKAVLADYAKRNNCSMNDVLQYINLIAKAEKADLNDGGWARLPESMSPHFSLI